MPSDDREQQLVEEEPLEDFRITTEEIEVVFRAMSQLTMGDISTQWITLHPVAINVIKRWSSYEATLSQDS
jgi:hypothetical protein